MALQSQVVSIPVSLGLDTKTDSKQVMAGKALVLENARFQKTGKLSKRFGLVALPATTNTGTLATPQFVFADNEYMGVMTDNGISAYSVGDSKWYNQNNLSLVSKIQTEYVLKNFFTQKTSDMDMTSDGTHTAYVTRQEGINFSSNIAIVLEDNSTGLKKTRNVILGSSNIGLQRVVCAKSSGVVYVHVFYYDGTNILRNIYDENMDVISSGTVILAASDSSQFDLCKNTNTIFLSVINTNTINLRSYDFLGVQQNTHTGAVTNALLTVGGFARGMSTVYSGNTLHVMWNYSSGGAIKGYTSALVASVTENTVAGGLTKVSINQSNGGGLSLITSNDTSSTKSISYSTATFTTTYVISVPVTYSRVVLASQAINVLGRDIALVKDSEPINKNFYVLDFTDAYMAQSFSPALSPDNFMGSSSTPVSMVSKTVNLNNIVYAAIDRVVGNPSSIDPGESFGSSGMSRTVHDFVKRVGDGSRYKVGDRIYLTAGATIEMDKINPYDNGYVMAPLITSVTANVSVANPNVAAKTFSYCAVYEYRDSSGQLTRSAPSLAVTIPTTAANTASIGVVIAIPVLNIKSRVTTTQFPSITSISVYRTETGPGSIFYLVANVLNVLNDGTTITYLDTAADSTIVNNERLYTTGGVLSANPAPVARFSASGGNRLFLAGLEEKDEIAYSQKQLFGESVYFNDDFRIRVSTGTSSDKSPISGIGYMDGKIIIFRERSLYYVSGDGPLATGLDNQFTEPETISSDVGCIESRSILNTKDGIMFKSKKGIYLLSRSFQVSYIGSPVEDFNSQVICASIISDKFNEARFYTTSGTCLVYNYVFETWSVFTNQTIVDADSWAGNPVSIKTSLIYQETENTYLDAGAAYAMKFTSPWLNLGNIQGYQRCYQFWMIGDYKSPHTLNCKIYQDFNDAVSEDYQLIYSSTDSPQYQFQISLPVQKVESIKFELYDSAQTGSGESYDLSNIQCEVAVKSGGYKLAATKSY